MKKGDIISVDYELWVIDDEESEGKVLLDTTKEGLAKEQDGYDEKRGYEPEDFIIGKERPFKVIDDSFQAAELGKEVEIEIPPADAYGEREMGKIQFRRKDELEILDEEKLLVRGARVTMKTPVDGLEGEGVVRVNTGRRVNVDFNHPLAGRSILYRYTVVKKYEEVGEILKSLFATFSSKIDHVHFTTADDDETLRITLPDICKIDNAWMLAKLFIVTSLRESLGFKTIIFEEVYESKKPEETAVAEDTGDASESQEDKTLEEPETEITLDIGGSEPAESEDLEKQDDE